MKGKIWHSFGIALVLTLAGCNRNQSQTVDTSMLSAPTSPQQEDAASGNAAVPTDMPAPADTNAEMPAPAPPADIPPNTPPISYQLPPGWTQQPGTDMRFATLIAPDKTQIAITVFPGDVGGELANINRWRKQLDLAPIAQNDLNQSVKSIPTPAGTALYVDLSNHDQRMLAAMLPRDNQTWFLKLMGPTQHIAPHTAEFMAILKSLR